MFLIGAYLIVHPNRGHTRGIQDYAISKIMTLFSYYNMSSYILDIFIICPDLGKNVRSEEKNIKGAHL